MYATYEANQPWVVYRYGLTHDRFWPPWNSTRVLGRSKVVCECAVCGMREVLSMKIPRFGPIPAPEGGKHPERIRFLREHSHPDRRHPMSWARPLLNPQAHPGGLNLDLFAMRLESDVAPREEQR